MAGGQLLRQFLLVEGDDDDFVVRGEAAARRLDLVDEKVVAPVKLADAADDEDRLGGLRRLRRM